MTTDTTTGHSRGRRRGAAAAKWARAGRPRGRIILSGDSPCMASLRPSSAAFQRRSRRHCAASVVLLGERNRGQESTRVKDASDQDETGDLWVFGYGSLMWRPGFEVAE